MKPFRTRVFSDANVALMRSITREGRSVSQVARAIGSTEGSVRTWASRLKIQLIPAPDRIGLATPAELDSCESHRSPAEAAHTGSLVLGNRRGPRFNPFWSWYKIEPSVR